MTDRHIWEDISTATKDGTLMFLDYGDGVLRIGRWGASVDAYECHGSVYSSEGEQWLAGQDGFSPGQPLRWMEFPSAPLPYREEDEAA